MITIFDLESPILEGIKQQFIEDVDSVIPNESERVLFLDYELSETEISATSGFSVSQNNKPKYNAAVMCFAQNSNYTDALSTATQNQTGDNDINIVIAGFGDIITEDSSEEVKFNSTKTATQRAQVLAKIAFKSTQNRTIFNKGFEGATGIKLLEKSLQSAEKGGVVGATESTRSVVIYSYTYRIRLTDVPPSEPLGPDYEGSTPTVETETE